MLFREILNLPVAVLGFGTMRLPTIDGKDSQIDKEQTAAMVDLAMKRGVNYFDTAWGYHNGQSELVMGEILQKYPRESFYLASKFPGYDVSNFGKVEEIFERQLEKCRVKYFDFYLIHNVCEINIEKYLDDSYGTRDYLAAQVKNGRIKHLGFSVHGSYEVMERFLAKYGDLMEFCQVQLNYVDFDFQDAKLKMTRLKELNLPVIVMEPLRGGSLAKMRPADRELFDKAFPGADPVEVAFRYLTAFSTVKVILSGMSDMAQLQRNLDIFDLIIPFKEDNKQAAEALGRAMTGRLALPCTGCKYCLSHCPQGLDIPTMMSHYNEHHFSDGGFLAPMAIKALPREKQPQSCQKCGQCESVCPQQLKISEIMDKLVDAVKKCPF